MKGLLFIPEMALKACDGTKTQTRRVLGLYPRVDLSANGMADTLLTTCCDYKTGERRALLTTWAVAPEFDHLKPTELDPNRVSGHFWHAGQGDKPAGLGKSRPGRFLPNVLRGLMMPMFDITEVRVERVQDISEADALAEGVQEPRIIDIGGSKYPWTHRNEFEDLWNSINADRGYSWPNNPVVAVITFNRL